MARRKSIARDRILDAAQAVAMRHGAQVLTLDMVAAEAGISKGGLTYSFATKEALLSALLDRDVERFRDRLAAIGAAPDEDAFSELRAFLAICRDSRASAEKKISAILAAVTQSPGSLTSTRDYLKWMLAKCSGPTAQGRRARLIFFATQGLFLLQGFGMLSLPIAQRKALIEDCISFLDASPR